MRYLRSLVCDRTARAVCCPTTPIQSVLDPACLLASMAGAGAGAECAPNPCPDAFHPWQDPASGATGCHAVGRDGVSDCGSELLLEAGKLVCSTHTTNKVGQSDEVETRS